MYTVSLKLRLNKTQYIGSQRPENYIEKKTQIFLVTIDGQDIAAELTTYFIIDD